MLYSRIQKSQESSFKILNSLIAKFQVEFISFAKIYLTQLIKSMNEALSFDKSFIFECFSKILTLSYLESKEQTLHLTPDLLKLHQEGQAFLFEFKNNQSFQVDFSAILTQGLKNFHLREYQLEGIKWINFLFKYGLSGALCDDMGLGKTIQSLIGVALKYSHGKSKLDSLVVCPQALLFHWEKEA